MPDAEPGSGQPNQWEGDINPSPGQPGLPIDPLSLGGSIAIRMLNPCALGRRKWIQAQVSARNANWVIHSAAGEAS